MSETYEKEKAPRRPQGPMGRGHGRPVEKAKDFKGTLRKLLKYLSVYKVGIGVVIFFAVLSTVFNVIGPKVLSLATTELFNGLVAKIQGTGSIQFDRIAKILLSLLAIYLFSALMSFIQGYIMAGVAQKMSFRMRSEISEKIHRLPMAYFESKTVGEILSRITNDVDTLGQSLNQSVTQVITSLTTMIGVLVMMLSISPWMTLIALVILPISLGLVMLVVKFSQKYFIAQQRTLGEINGQVEETFAGQNIVKAFNKEEDVLAEFRVKNEELYRSAWKSQFLSGLMQPVMTFVGNLGYVAVAIAGSVFAVAGSITVGDIQAFIQYVKNFTQPIQQMANVSNLLQSTVAAAERVFEFLEEKEEEEPEHPLVMDHVEGAVSFEHVQFGYQPGKPIIHDFSSEVRPGQMVAIVGPTGAGKTTMVKLLMRFYDVDAGCIRIDGQDIRSFGRSNLREHFGMVLQDTWLFKGTIMENIRYGKLTASDAEVMDAAKAAHAHHFIETLPGGYDFVLNEEATNVSQGQRQLLTIARSILADNPILILDEATQGVDVEAKTQIYNILNNLTAQGKAILFISSDIAEVMGIADRIMVIRHGRVVKILDNQALDKEQVLWYATVGDEGGK